MPGSSILMPAEKGNSIRYTAVTERDPFMKVKDVENLFCGGEKSGLFIGHTEAILLVPWPGTMRAEQRAVKH